MLQNNKYLHLVSLQSLINWSVAHLISRDLGFTKKFPFIRIGDIISRSTILITVEDEILYKQVTVKTNGGGAVLRDEKNGKKKGKDIGIKKQYIAREGQFIMSKIDARNGAFGIISKELEGAIVTGDFPLFDVNAQKVDPFYLYLLSTTKPFVKYAQSCSRGTTNRQRIDIDMFLSQEIPLPSLAEQKNIVDAYNYAISQAENYAQEADKLDEKVVSYWQTILGVEQHKEIVMKKTGYLQLCHFRYIEKWGCDFIRRGKDGISQTKYPSAKIADLCSISSGGTPARGRREYYGGNIPWIKTGELKNEELFNTEEKITELGLKNSSAKLYPEGSLIVAMYGATIGKTAKLKVDATTNQACAVLFNIQNTRISTDYLWQYIQSQTDNLKSMAYGGAQPNINAGIIANYQIPLPPLDIQNEIVEHIAALRTEQKELRQKALLLRQQATQQFEQTIFN